jgi:hypothetical protein
MDDFNIEGVGAGEADKPGAADQEAKDGDDDEKRRMKKVFHDGSN